MQVIHTFYCASVGAMRCMRSLGTESVIRDSKLRLVTPQNQKAGFDGCPRVDMPCA